MKMIKGVIDVEKVKRLYISGCVATIECPNCGNTLEQDFNSQYLSHVQGPGTTEDIYFYCKYCDERGNECEWRVEAQVIKVEICLAYDSSKVLPG